MGVGEAGSQKGDKILLYFLTGIRGAMTFLWLTCQCFFLPSGFLGIRIGAAGWLQLCGGFVQCPGDPRPRVLCCLISVLFQHLVTYTTSCCFLTQVAGPEKENIQRGRE